MSSLMPLKKCIYYWIVSCGLLFSTAYAGVQVTGVKVDAKAETGMKAREQAMIEARRKAFEKLVKENDAYAYDMDAKGLPSDEDLEAAVENFEIQQEKVSAKRYVGTLSLTFNTKAIKRLVGSSASQKQDQTGGDEETDGGETLATLASSSAAKKSGGGSGKSQGDLLILPIYITPDDSLFWHANNPWNDFLDRGAKDGSFKILVPLGDLRDIKAVTIEDVMMGNHQAVDALLNRYGKERAVIGLLKRSSTESFECELTVKVFQKGRLEFSNEPVIIQGTSLQDSFQKAKSALILALNGGGSPMGGFQREDIADDAPKGDAATMVSQNYESTMGASSLKTDQYNTTQNGPKADVSLYDATATFRTFEQWQQIRSAMATSSVQSFDVSNLTRNRAKISLRSSVALSVLMKDLARKGITVEEIAPNTLVLTVGVPVARRPLEPSRSRSDLPAGTRPLGEVAPTRMD